MEDNRAQQIRARAYEIWENEGRPQGKEKEHWDQAEREFEEPQATNAGGGASPSSKTRAQRQSEALPGDQKRKRGAARKKTVAPAM